MFDLLSYSDGDNLKSCMIDGYPDVDRSKYYEVFTSFSGTLPGQYDFSNIDNVFRLLHSIEGLDVSLFVEMWNLRRSCRDARDVTYEQIQADPLLLHSLMFSLERWEKNLDVYSKIPTWLDMVFFDWCLYPLEYVDPASFKEVDYASGLTFSPHSPCDIKYLSYGFTPTFFLDEVRGKSSYAPPAPARFYVHNGQLKNFFNLTQFVNSYARDGDTVLVYGAAPGYGVTSVVSLYPTLTFVFVDDFPMYNRDGAKYLSISAFEEGLVQGDRYDLLYYDWYDPSLTMHQFYDSMESLAGKLNCRAISLKRFANSDNGVRCFRGNRAALQLFSAPSSVEVREEGNSSSDPGTISSCGIHYYNNVIRKTRGPCLSFSPCSCYDCSVASYKIVQYSGSNLSRSTLAEWLEVIQSFVELQKPNVSSLLRDTFGSEKGFDSVCGLKHSLLYWFSEECKEVLENAFPLTSYKAKHMRRSVVKIAEVRPPMVCHTDDGDRWILPSVTVYSGGSTWFSFPGDYRDYNDSDAGSYLSCYKCGIPGSLYRINLRKYLARFRPTVLSCTACQYETSLSYCPVEGVG